MEPTSAGKADGHLEVKWNKDDSRDVVGFDGDPIKAMNAVMSRRLINAMKPDADTYSNHDWINADLGDIADFIEGRVDVHRIADLLWGLILVDWPAVDGYPLKRRDRSDSLFPCAAYGLLKLCFPCGKVRDIEIPIVPEIHRKASVGDGFAATERAIRRLRGSGLYAATTALGVSREQIKRIAAALLFPLNAPKLETIATKVLRPKEKED
jgi:CRISPR-associated protein Csx17